MFLSRFLKFSGKFFLYWNLIFDLCSLIENADKDNLKSAPFYSLMKDSVIEIN